MENENFNGHETMANVEVKTESELKELIVNYVGNRLNPESEKITVEQVIDVFSQEFPEFLLVIAEENWINGYTQALRDVEFSRNEQEKTQNEQDNTENKTEK